MTTTTDTVPETSALQMARAEVNAREFRRWMGVRRFLDPDHAMHCLLTESFGGLAPKPFRLIMGRDAPTGVLYGYGSADADALREAAAICADPLQCRIVPADTARQQAHARCMAGGQAPSVLRFAFVPLSASLRTHPSPRKSLRRRVNSMRGAIVPARNATYSCGKRCGIQTRETWSARESRCTPNGCRPK